MGLLVYLAYNALHADWKLDPLWNLLYARIRGPIFYLAHSSSMLGVVAVAIIKVAPNVLKTSQPTRWIVAVFSTVSVHELDLDLIKLTGGIGYLDSLNYMLYLLGFLVLAFIICTPYQKRVILTIGAILIPFFILTEMLFYIGTDVIDFNYGPDIYSPSTNAVEVSTWLTASAVWFLPERWFQWRLRR
ncbi:MAG: hypothetical protein KGH74_03555 [Candidatus Micrarchaeota archaeon]|nr:hypothetical protein [Candidatus Micrarchaeota archaeon]